jgi:hypothetical protein
MDSQASKWSLQLLLSNCCDEHNRNREIAWREFLHRYKSFIYRVITHRCLNWRVTRLRRQLSEAVNDVVSEVLTILTQSLNQYREVGDEDRFRFWLGTVCNRATSRYLKREFFSEMAEPDLEEFQNYIEELEFDSRWELYETIINRLRSSDSNRKRNLERDINLFQLYIWSDLSQPMIQSHPCYTSLGHRVIDNVVNRLKEQLKKEKNQLS